MKNMINLENKTILVAGASSGIGRAVCEELDRRGARVMMIARSEEEKGNPFQNRGGEKHKYYQFDLTHIDKIEDLIKRIVKENGKLDGLVYTAGVSITRSLNMTTYDILHESMLIGFYAFVEMVRVYAKKKHNNGGSIVALSAYSSLRGERAKHAYSAAKAAMDAAVRSIAVELRPKGIRVNSIQPGWVRTKLYDDYINNFGDDAQKRFINEKNTVVEPVDIAKAVMFLLSEDADVFSGISVIANGVGL